MLRKDNMTIPERFLNKIVCGDCLTLMKELPDESVDCVITSPPYWGLRDYGVSGQVGLENTLEEYVGKLVSLFGEVKRVLKKEGTIWLNLGDSYAGSNCGSNDHREEGASLSKSDEKYKGQRPGLPEGLKPKDLVGIPWRVAFALQAEGWFLRQDIIWSKPNPMPESMTDRCTKSHEYVFLLAKSAKYFFDGEAIKEPFVSNNNTKSKGTRGKLRTTGARNGDRDFSGGFPYPENGRNKRSVWTINTKPFGGAHFATFPEELIKPMVLAGCPVGGIVLDPFMGAGTTSVVAKRLGRNFIGMELNPDYCKIAEERLKSVMPMNALKKWEKGKSL